MKINNNSSLLRLTECSVMLALAIALSFVKIWSMPMGGNVTLLSMLPIVLIAIKYPLRHALSTALVFAVWQLAEGFFSGDVFVYCTTPAMVVIVILFDYLLPFTCLGFAGIFKNVRFRRFKEAGILAGIVLVIVFRFVCHYITGFSIWGQWAPEGQSKFIYSLIYNGQYMLPELIFTTIAAIILVKLPPVKKLLGIKTNAD